MSVRGVGRPTAPPATIVCIVTGFAFVLLEFCP